MSLNDDPPSAPDKWLTKSEMFAAWAPSESPWSAWAKPVLFDAAPVVPRGKQPDLPAIAGLNFLRETALIIDLRGPESLLVGLALSQAGFQPVPLYNGVAAHAQLVQMDDIADMLPWGPVFFAARPPRPDAPPAFLINIDRQAHDKSAALPGRFDNRWAVVPQDFPSADFLKQKGITRAVLVSPSLQPDVAHILYAWQQAGLRVEQAPDPATRPKALAVSRPSRFRSLWYRLAIFAGLRRNAAGGFGAIVPDPSQMSGGGGYG